MSSSMAEESNNDAYDVNHALAISPMTVTSYRDSIIAVLTKSFAHFCEQNTERAPAVFAKIMTLLSPCISQRSTFIRPLGKGAFGTVSLMRSPLDGRFEAVKRIPFVSTLPPWQLCTPSDDVICNEPCNEILREVRALAACQHTTSVVRYYHSWIEPDWQKLGTMMCDAADERRNAVLLLDAANDNNDRDQINCASTVPPASEKTLRGVWPYTLYISTEPVFGMTLEHWLCDRNSKCTPMVPYMFTAREILATQHITRGLLQVHLRGIIHRDLKPSNIFVVDDDHMRIKISDFGLASISKLTSQNMVIYDDIEYTRLPEIEKTGHDSNLTLTANVGTPTYCAPELVDENTERVIYDEKADMFSLGLIILELLMPFGTAMERAHVLSTARADAKRLCDEICVREPLFTAQARLIARLLEHDPVKRPSCLQAWQCVTCWKYPGYLTGYDSLTRDELIELLKERDLS